MSRARLTYLADLINDIRHALAVAELLAETEPAEAERAVQYAARLARQATRRSPG